MAWQRQPQCFGGVKTDRVRKNCCCKNGHSPGVWASKHFPEDLIAHPEITSKRAEVANTSQMC